MTLLAERLKRGELYEDCVEELDEVLGTGMEERDREAEGQWAEWKESDE